MGLTKKTKKIDVDTEVAPYLGTMALKVGAANAGMWLVGVGICAFLFGSGAFDFSVGVIIGVLSLYLSLRILRKGIAKGADGAATYVAVRYYIKFILIMLALGFVVWQLKLSLVAISIGYTATIFTTILAILVSSREEFQYG